jgi:hypothetical protein
MSERFGIPDHAPQHAPDHAAQNPTAQGSWDPGGGGAAADWPAPTRPIGGSGGPNVSIHVDPHKSVKVGIVLAMLLGPLGLFYVSFLNGAVALFTVIPFARWLTPSFVNTFDGSIDRIWVAVAITWCITVPWAITGVLRHNRKIDR